MKPLFAALTGFLILIGIAATASAHHGWRWTTGGNIELIGIIQSAKLGNPHGVLTVDAEGEIWTVEVGQPWRNERAGVQDGDLSEGVEIRVVGEPAADASQKLLKAEKFYIGDREFVLYPERN
ncbi:DUF6152 family protein [Pacificispira sp.]|uniref:DUF6152 family protein n=1 Tax=Pacificispira sp. TaxID=2888761 RepID=UPI003BA99035